MSFSVNFIGHPENVKTALLKHSETLIGSSKEEYDTALPNIINLVDLNYNKKYTPTIRVSVNGHGYKTSAGTDDYNNVSVTIAFADGQVV